MPSGPVGASMVRAPGVQVPTSEAEATRRRLVGDGTLRADLRPRKDGDTIVFPTSHGDTTFEFEPRIERPRDYQSLLPDDLAGVAPRAFEAMGDIGLLKVPHDLWDHRATIGEALRAFLDARAVFHDGGVKGDFRVRHLERIAGMGDSATVVQENGVRLHVDVGAAYFSPRLADERARVAGLVQPNEHLVDLFGGVAPLGVQAAKAGARVTTVDLNPAATDLAARNADANGVALDVRCGDARAVAAELEPADRIVMNLPHGAKHFLDVAVALARPGATIHHHEILPNDDLDNRVAELATLGVVRNVRHVRNYSASESHICFDIQVPA